MKRSAGSQVICDGEAEVDRTAANLAWLVKEASDRTAHPAIRQVNRTDGTFSRSDFVFEAERNHYTCPQGKLLCSSGEPTRRRITKDRTRLYRSSKSDCQGCTFKAKCCPNTSQRKVPRDLDEDARDVTRLLANTPAHERLRHRRKKVEMLFAHLKRILRLDRFRLKGPLCSGRAPPRGHGPEPPEDGKADPAGRPNAGLKANKLTRV
jgi:hypothetical protein